MQMFDRIVKYYTMCVSQKGKPRQKANFIMKKACKFVSFTVKGYDICLFGFCSVQVGRKEKKISSESTVKFTKTEIRCWVLKKNNCYLGNFLSGHSWSEYCVSKRVPLFTGHPAALISKHLPQLSLSPDIMTSHFPRSSQQPFSAAASPVAPEPHETGRHVFTVVGVYQACCVPSNPNS